MAKILVVDDEEAFAFLVGECLRTAGYQVVMCVDPALAEAAAIEEKADMALIDYNMPGKTGVQLLADLRARAQTRNLPVLFLSGTQAVRFASQVPPEPRVRFLSKPLDTRALLTVVREMLDPNSWSSAS